MAESEEERAKADEMRQQHESSRELVSASAWSLCQQDCVSGEAPVSVLFWRLGLEAAGWPGQYCCEG